MKKYLSLLFFYCLFSAEGKAQVNLVPNYSFSPSAYCLDAINGIFIAHPWFQPAKWQGNTTNSSSSDLFDSCSSAALAGIPINMMGLQQARTGNSYAGILVNQNTSNYREYIEVALINTLIANKSYCIEFYVSLAETSTEAISNLGAYFSLDSIIDTSRFVQHPALDYITPQFENPVTNMLSSTSNWMQVSGMFNATGGEKFMTIGNFHKPANTNSQTIGVSNFPYAYYYIDDISVRRCNVGIDEIDESALQISPNPATSTITIETKNTILKNIHIYNVVGKCVKEIPRCAQNDKEIDISGFANGIYFVEVETEKAVVRKRFIKE